MTEQQRLQLLREQIIKLGNSTEYKRLNRYYRKKSFFNILGISRKETIHSYFLHWIFSPEESHEIGDYALRRLLELLVLVKNKLQANNSTLQFPEGIEDIITYGGYTLDGIVCEREHTTDKGDRLDLYLRLDFHSQTVDKHIHILLENKVKSREGREQTNRYFNYGETLDGDKIYVFLSPTSNSDFEARVEPLCDNKHFIGLNYQYLVDYVLEPCLSECQGNDAQVFIEEYLRTLSQPSLQFEDNGGEVVMAVSSRERELLLNFWESNKDLLTAALSALADNPELDQEERDSIRESLHAVNKAGNKDFSTYRFNGEKYGKGRLVLAVVKQYVTEHINASYSELIQTFNKNGLKIIATLSEAKSIYKSTGRKRHFIDEPIQLKDGELAVSAEWGIGNIGRFIALAENLGYTIESVN
jgi:hypothetical protein